MTKVRRYAARRDGLEPDIMTALRHVYGDNISIQQLDVVDLLIGYAGRTILMEIKSDGGRLSDSQLGFLVHWQGEAYAVNNVEDAINAVRGTLEMGEPKYALYHRYHFFADDKFHQVTGVKFLLGEWWHEIDGNLYFTEKDLTID